MSNLSCGAKTGVGLLIALLHLTGCQHPSPAPTPATRSTAPMTASAAADKSNPKDNAFEVEADRALRAAAALPSRPFAIDVWRELYNGSNLQGWRRTPFAGEAEIEIKHGLIVMEMGNPFNGITYSNPLPRMNYEVALDAMRLKGNDFFCGLTVPVNDSFCSLIVGGWGGTLVGISSLDSLDASENETTKFIKFEQGRWYRIRLRVTEAKLEAWIDDEKIINVSTAGKRISLRPGEIEQSKPFGICCWQTSAALRQIKLRTIAGPDSAR